MLHSASGERGAPFWSPHPHTGPAPLPSALGGGSVASLLASLPSPAPDAGFPSAISPFNPPSGRDFPFFGHPFTPITPFGAHAAGSPRLFPPPPGSPASMQAAAGAPSSGESRAFAFFSGAPGDPYTRFLRSQAGPSETSPAPGPPRRARGAAPAGDGAGQSAASPAASQASPSANGSSPNTPNPSSAASASGTDRGAAAAGGRGGRRTGCVLIYEVMEEFRRCLQEKTPRSETSS
eukprot:tig00001071_g6799.t1